MTGISRSRWGRASWLCLAVACGGHAAAAGRNRPGPGDVVRVVPLDAAFVLETAGPPPPDTSVTFTAGVFHTIVLRHGPPDNLVFAELEFPPKAFAADSGRSVTVAIHPRPGVYGVDVTASLPLAAGASLTFKYARYFSAPARARAAYGTDVLYERALAIGQLRPGGQLAFLPSTRPASDNIRSALPGSGSYLVAAAK
jgi:hypothetical protein